MVAQRHVTTEVDWSSERSRAYVWAFFRFRSFHSPPSSLARDVGGVSAASPPRAREKKEWNGGGLHSNPISSSSSRSNLARISSVPKYLSPNSPTPGTTLLFSFSPASTSLVMIFICG